MRTKMLVLGAIPPFEGPWIPIQGGVTWGYSVVTRPVSASINGKLTLRVRDAQGNITSLPKGEKIRGTAVQAIIGKAEDLEMVSVFIKEEAQ